MCVAKTGSVTWATLLNVDLAVRSYGPGRGARRGPPSFQIRGARQLGGPNPFGHLRGLGRDVLRRYSGTFVNLRDGPEAPLGAYEYIEHLFPSSEKKYLFTGVDSRSNTGYV